jgi:hypothetical protein
MSKLKNILREGSEQHDDILREAVRNHLDKDLRKELMAELEKDYGIKRPGLKAKRRILGFPLRSISIAASLAILMGALLWLFFPSQQDPEYLAYQFLGERLVHPGASKGASTVETNRNRAIASFNQGQFTEAIVHYNTMDSLRYEDKFYLSVAMLKAGQYQDNCSMLQVLSTEENVLHEEIRWYLALCLVLNEDMDTARDILNSFRPEDWKYSDAQRLKKSLK